MTMYFSLKESYYTPVTSFISATIYFSLRNGQSLVGVYVVCSSVLGSRYSISSTNTNVTPYLTLLMRSGNYWEDSKTLKRDRSIFRLDTSLIR